MEHVFTIYDGGTPDEQPDNVKKRTGRGKGKGAGGILA